MIVEGLGSVTFVNGVLRVQLTKVNGEGKIVESGTLEIPGSKVSDVIQGIANATQGISDKLNEDGDSSGEDKKKSSKKDNEASEDIDYRENFQKNGDLSGELNKLNELLKNGVLTQEEFEKAKKKIIYN